MGSLTKALIGKEDVDVNDNELYPSTFSRLNSTGSTITLTSFPDIWKTHQDALNARSYGTQVGATINTAVAAGTTCRDIYLDAGEWVVSNTIDWSSYTTTRWIFAGGAYLTLNAGVTVTFPSPASIVASPNQQIFSGAGTVAFSTGGTVYPEWWGATTSGDNSAALQKCFTAGAHGRVMLTQLYTSAAAIAVDHYTTVQGIGKNSGISFNHTGDGITSTWPINASTSVHILLDNFYLYNSNAGNVGHAFVDVGGTFVTVQNLYIQGWKHGVVFDQTEVSRIRDCKFIGQSEAGIWLVNGDDHTALADEYYTNQIVIEGNHIGSSAGVYNIIDDGGVNHVIRGNNLYGGVNAFRLAGGWSVTFSDNYSEGHTTGIYFLNYTLAATPTTDSYGVIVSGNMFGDLLPAYNLYVDFVHGLVIHGNHLGVKTAAAILLANTTSNVSSGVSLVGNTKTITGANRSDTLFLNGSANPAYRVNVNGQPAMTYVASSLSAGVVTVTPKTMELIHERCKLLCYNEDGTNAEEVEAVDITSTTFDATFASDKAANWCICGCNTSHSYRDYATDSDFRALTVGKGIVLRNAAGTVKKRVRLNDTGDGLLYENE